MSQQRKFIRNPTTRHLLFWGVLFGTALGIALTTPARDTILILLAWAVGGVVGLVVGIFGIIMLISTLMAVSYWLRHGYLTSPWSHSPWGKFHLGGAEYPHEY